MVSSKWHWSQILFELGQLFRFPYRLYGYVLFLWLHSPDYNKWACHYMIYYKISYYFAVYVSNLEKHVTIFKMYLLPGNHDPMCSSFRSNPCTSIECRTKTNKKIPPVPRGSSVHRYTRKMLYCCVYNVQPLKCTRIGNRLC